MCMTYGVRYKTQHIFSIAFKSCEESNDNGGDDGGGNEIDIASGNYLYHFSHTHMHIYIHTVSPTYQNQTATYPQTIADRGVILRNRNAVYEQTMNHAGLHTGGCSW